MIYSELYQTPAEIDTKSCADHAKKEGGHQTELIADPPTDPTADNCYDCHNGNYNSTPNLCYDCHTSEYNNSTNPSHLSAQFPTDCEECHTQNSWVPSTFDHDSQYFPINSGKHREAWNDCSDCHTNAADYGVFSCIDCHEHNQTEMDDDHSEVADYRYQSTACFDCHPNGTADEGGKTHFKMEKILK